MSSAAAARLRHSVLLSVVVTRVRIFSLAPTLAAFQANMLYTGAYQQCSCCCTCCRLLNTTLVANISICPIKLYGKAGLGVSRRTAIRLSCTARCHKSAYTHLHFGGLEHCCASQTHMNISHHTIRDFTPNSATPAVQIPAKPSQTQVSSQTQYNLLAKGISCWQKADAVTSRSH